MSNTKRVDYIDIAKGIGILMVIFGHAYQLPHNVFLVIFSVHMPLFFILSGCVFRCDPKEPFRRFLKRQAKGLLLPYICTSVIIIILKAVIAAIRGRSIWEQVRLWAVAALYGSGARVPEGMEDVILSIGVIWFLLAMFIGRVLLRLFLYSGVPWLWAIICFALSYLSTSYFWLPFSIQPGLCSVIFLYLGYEIGRHDMFRIDKCNVAVRLVSAAVWVLAILFGGKLCMVENLYDNCVINLIGAVCGTVTIVSLSQLIERYIGFLRRPLRFLGQISLGLMCAHLISLMCWMRDDVIDWMQARVSWPAWVCDEIDIIVITAVVTLILYYIPVLNRYLFPARRKKTAA